jgi:hypothetical protein
VCELGIPVAEKPEHLQIAVVLTERTVADDWLDLLEHALAEPLEGEWPELAKGLPV